MIRSLLKRTVGEPVGFTEQLELERDQARAETETAMEECRELESDHRREQASHRRARRRGVRLGIAMAVLVVLLAVAVLVVWLLLT